MPAEEASAKLEHEGQGTLGGRMHRGKAYILKKTLLSRSKDGEFICPPKGDVRGSNRRANASVEKYATAPEPIRIFRDEFNRQLEKRFFSSVPDDATLMSMILDPTIKVSAPHATATARGAHARAQTLRLQRAALCPHPSRS